MRIPKKMAATIRMVVGVSVPLTECFAGLIALYFTGAVMGLEVDPAKTG